MVNRYHIDTDLSCAESVFQACNEYYQLNLSEETRKMFSVMGIGMQTRLSCCGAFTVAAGMIGLFTAGDGQRDIENESGYELICELTEFMFETYGTMQCLRLNQLDLDGYEDPCECIVESIAKKLEELLEDKKIYAAMTDLS